MSRRDPSTAAELVAAGKRGEGPAPLVIAKEWLRSAVTGNLALKAVAFLLALTLFILVHSDEDEIVPVTVKLKYASPRDGLTLVEEPPQTARVNIQGSRRRLRRFTESELDTILITLTQSGEFVFQSDMVRPLPEGLEVVSISPPSISLVYESTEDKKISVRPRTIGQVAAGYRVQSVRAEPEALEIRGAESAVSRLEELATQPIDISGATGTIETNIALAVPPFPAQIVVDGKTQTPQDLEVKVVIEVVPAQGMVRYDDVAVKIRAADGVPGNVADSWSASPATVSLVLRGDQLALSAPEQRKAEVFVRVFPADVVARIGRSATLEVDDLGEGIAVEIIPRTVKLEPK